MATNTKSTLSARGREMYALIERYLSSGLRQKAFCADAGVSLTTFQYWLYRYRADKGMEKGSGKGSGGNEFVALRPAEVIMRTPSRYDCELLLPNGIILRLAERPDAAWLLDVAGKR